MLSFSIELSNEASGAVLFQVSENEILDGYVNPFSVWVYVAIEFSKS